MHRRNNNEIKMQKRKYFVLNHFTQTNSINQQKEKFAAQGYKTFKREKTLNVEIILKQKSIAMNHQL